MSARIVSKGGGITAGLEIWLFSIKGADKFVLVDRSPDGRFASDTQLWNAAAGLNAAALKKLKDATK
jgi:hypothetical protein